MAAKMGDSGEQAPDRAGWRGKAKSRVPAARHRWQQNWGAKRRQEVARKNLRHRTKVLLAVGAAAALLGLFVYLVFIMPRHAPLIAVLVTKYSAPLPPNAWAWEDVERFQANEEPGDDKDRWYWRLLPAGKRRNLKLLPVLSEADAADSALDQLAEAVDNATPGGPRRNVILVYLSAHGVLDAAGEPCLVLADAAPASPSGQPQCPHLDESRWLRLRALVKRIEGSAPGAKKVLILDANRMHANWSLGLLYNGFAERLPDVVEGVRDVVILNSTSPGEIGWPSPELEGSVFGHFVWRGLRGYDDSDQDGDGRVSLAELHRYLQKRVDHWVFQNRLDRQVPMLVPHEAEDFDLVWKEPQPPGLPTAVAAGKAAAPSGDEDGLAELWARHEKLLPWRNDGEGGKLARDQLLLWERFQRRLLRLEQLVAAGKAYQQDTAATRSQLAGLIKVLEAPPRAPRTAAHSLPLALVRPDRWRNATDLEAQRKAVRQSLLDPSRNPPAAVSRDYLVRAQEAWQSALQHPEQDLLERALQVAGRPEAAFGPELVEIHFLRLLAPPGNLPAGVWKSTATTVAPALACRQAAEEAAAPPDERAHYWVRALVEQADGDRRRAEDNLFIGRRLDLEEAARQSSAARETYDRALGISGQVAFALAVRDRAWAELPYLAQWISRRPAADPSAPELASRLGADSSAVVRTIRLTHALGRELDDSLGDCLQSPEAARDRAHELEARAKLVQRSLRDLNRSFHDRVAAVADQAKDQRTLREIEALLAVPLVTGEMRHSLRLAYAEIASARRPQPAGLDDATPSVRHKRPTDETGYLRHASQWQEHPALALLSRTNLEPGGLAEETGQEPSGEGNRSQAPAGNARFGPGAPGARQTVLRLAREGGQVRRLLGELADRAEAWLADEQPKARQPGAPEAIAAARAGLSRADRLVRAALVLWEAPEAPFGDPQRRLREFDLHHLLVWHAQRALDDFWGPSGSHGEQEPYFAAVAASYRQSAKQLYKRESAAWDEQQPRLQKLTAAARQAVRPAIEEESPVLDEPTFTRPVSLQLAADLPPGAAAVFARDPADPLRPPLGVKAAAEAEFHERLSIPIQSAAGAALLPIDFERRAPAGQQLWELVGLYRGHARTSPLPIVPPGAGIEIVHQRPVYGKSEVTVFGEEQEPVTVVFILDCSGSMANPVGRGGGKKRMDAAREALAAIIDRLAGAGNYMVGLWLYGHRLGVRVVGGEPEWSTAWGERDPDVSLGDDVQNVLDVELLNEATKSRFLELLSDRRKVGARGATPLYLAITEALKDDLRQERGGPRRLVVITDGQNDQPSGYTTKRRTAADVAAAFELDRRGGRQGAARLHIVDCAPREASELEGLVNDPAIRGAYHRVNDFADLEQELVDALGLYKYAVDGVQSGAPDQTLGERVLGETMTIDKPAVSRQEHLVRLMGSQVNSRFALEGGESLQFFLEQDARGWRLVHRRYDRAGETSDASQRNPNPRAGGVDDDFNPPELYIAAHRPETLDSGAVKFPISIQNADAERFSPRPAEAWVEITPVCSPPRDNVFRYPIYDLAYEPGRPVPVLSCLAPGWPADALAAEIRLWCKLARTRPTKEKPLEEVRTSDHRPHPELDLEPAPGVRVRFSVRVEPLAGGQGFVVVVSETQPLREEGLYPVKVELFEPADEVRHQYYPQLGHVRHLFVYRGGSEAQVQRQRLRLTTRDDLERDSISLARPLRATIVDRRAP